MTCFKRKEVVWFLRGNGEKWKKVVVIGHDPQSDLGELFVIFPRTRHIPRVRREWLQKLEGGE